MVDQPLSKIVQAFQAGSREAFEILVGRFQNLVTSVAFANTGDLQRSEDIAQQAFLVAWQKQLELRDPERFGGWIRGITNNLARNDRRLKENVHQQSAVSLSQREEPLHTATPDQLASRREQNELLWATLDQIPIEYREPLVLYYREDQSVAIVAEQLGLSEDAVKQRLKRGRAMMKREVENMVEQFLEDTRPTSAFSTGVMASLPVLGAAAGSTAVKVGGAMLAKTGGAKAAGIIAAGATGAGIGFFGGLFGLFAGVGGAWLGTRTAIKHATSEEEVQLHKSTFLLTVILSLVFTGGLLIGIFWLEGWKTLWMMVVINTVFFVSWAAIIVRFVAKRKSLHQKYGMPDYMINRSGTRPFKVLSPLALRFNAFAIIGGMWTWVIVLSALHHSWGMLATSLVVLSIHFVVIWISASAAITIPDQMRFNGAACLFASITQVVVVSCGALLGARNFDVGWAAGVLVFFIGGGVAWFCFRIANELDVILGSKTD